jgi:hypothetical protein
VKVTGDRPSLDQARVDAARIVIGLKGYVTNIPAEKLDGPAVVAAYHDLFQVEQSFRIAKIDLRARPIFHHRRDSCHEVGRCGLEVEYRPCRRSHLHNRLVPRTRGRAPRLSSGS